MELLGCGVKKGGKEYSRGNWKVVPLVAGDWDERGGEATEGAIAGAAEENDGAPRGELGMPVVIVVRGVDRE